MSAGAAFASCVFALLAAFLGVGTRFADRLANWVSGPPRLRPLRLPSAVRWIGFTDTDWAV